MKRERRWDCDCKGSQGQRDQQDLVEVTDSDWYHGVLESRCRFCKEVTVIGRYPYE